MKKNLSLLLLLCMMIGLFGCGKNTAENYTPTGDALEAEDLTILATEEPDEEEIRELNFIYYKDLSMNPFTCTEQTNRALFSLLYQGLFTVDANYRTQPMLCSRYTYAEDLFDYTFYIDERATFSDGTPVTAQDVAASIYAAMESDIYHGRLYYIDGVEVLPDGGVKVYLLHAYEDLPILLDFPILKATQVRDDHPLGTGPYTLVSTLNGGRLARRTNWWCNAEIPIDLPYITLLEAQSPPQIRDEFQFRDLDLVCTDPGSGLYADYLSDFELWDCENGFFMYLAASKESTVFSAPGVKAALTYAIDRDLLVTSYYRGHARSASLPASPASPYYNAALASRYAYAPEKFKAALESAGMVNATVTLLVNADDSQRLQSAKEISRMLDACGLHVDLYSVGADEYREVLTFGEYDLYLGMTQLSANMDLSQFFYVWGSLCYAGTENEELFALALNALSNSGNYYNLHRQVMDTGVICPILFRNYAIYATRGAIKDLNPARDAIFYYSIGKSMDDAYFDPS